MRGAALAPLLALLLAACPDEDRSPPARAVDLTARAPDSRPAPDLGNPACRKVGRQTVHFKTDDGVRLEADLYRASPEPGGPVALLLHMIPPRFDRKSWPVRFIDALVLRGVAVLNLDRRGAGGSGGVAREAYRGPKGWLDVKAAQRFLAGQACPPDLTRLVCIGASNGSTSCLDYAVETTKDSGLARPRALVFLSGGSYTEAQHRIADNRRLLEQMPLLLVYPAAEARWSAALKRSAPKAWKSYEHKGGHGTRALTAHPESIARIADFVEQAVKR